MSLVQLRMSRSGVDVSRCLPDRFDLGHYCKKPGRFRVGSGFASRLSFMKQAVRVAAPGVFALALVALVAACGSSDSGSQVGAGTLPSTNGSGTSPNLDLGGKDPTSSTGGPNGSGTATSCQPTTDSSGCVGEQFAGEGVPLDVYILFDQSCSMSCPISRGGPGQCCVGGPDPRIAPVRQAMDQFLHDSKSTNISFGIGYFGAQPLGSASCDAAFYEKPAVAIGPGQADTIVASLDAAQPTGETPTGAALRGACHYAKQDKHATPGHSVVILLVTDGIPETPVTRCGATLADAVQAASACAGDAETPIKTYVLGVGQALSNLNQIAAAGQTSKARLVDGGDVAQSMLAALNEIRGDAAIPCQLEIPPPPRGGDLDLTQVNVNICDAAGKPQSTYNVASNADCGSTSGWYYDDPANPQKIMLCKASCDTVSTSGAQLYYTVGCATQVTVR
jgi:hypothetical protein